MLKLLIIPVITTIIAFSLFPKGAAEFKEEQQGIKAASKKVVKVYKKSSEAYRETREDIKIAQKQLARSKKEIEKGIELANKASSEVSELCGKFASLTKGVKDSAEKMKANVTTGERVNSKK